jgi:hypothetical protein
VSAIGISPLSRAGNSSVGTSLVLNFSKGPGKYRAAFTTKRMSEQPVEIPFPWSIEQVEAIADEFFRKKSSNLREELRSSAAAREAVAHLLARRRACEKAVQDHQQTTAALTTARKLAQEREQQLVEYGFGPASVLVGTQLEDCPRCSAQAHSARSGSV